MDAAVVVFFNSTNLIGLFDRPRGGGWVEFVQSPNAFHRLFTRRIHETFFNVNSAFCYLLKLELEATDDVTFEFESRSSSSQTSKIDASVVAVSIIGLCDSQRIKILKTTG